MRPVVMLLALAWAVPALAHIHMLQPEPRYTENEQKAGPCGRIDGERTPKVTVLEPGATIEVVWEETVSHPGYYRIAFDDDGHDDFGDPLAPGGGNPPEVLVLLDEIGDQPNDPYRVEVTLPDIACTNCTLQLIQVMTDKAPYGDGNDIYYNCADLELAYGAGTGTDPEPPDTDTEPDDTGTPVDPAAPVVEDEKGCNTGGAPFGSLALVLALAMLATRSASITRRR